MSVDEVRPVEKPALEDTATTESGGPTHDGETKNVGSG